MNFKEGQRIIAVANGFDYGCSVDSRGSSYTHDYAIGWKGTMGESNIITFDNGRVIQGCDQHNFEELKEETKMKPGDTVLVKGCKGMMLKFNGKTGIIVENENDIIISEFPYRICFDGTGISCGYLFADSELELIDEYPMDCGAAFKALIDGKMVIDSEGSVLSFNKDIMRFQCRTDGGYVNVSTLPNDVKFKEYVATPKFKRGDFVEVDGKYLRISQVDTKHDPCRIIYGLTSNPVAFGESFGSIYRDEEDIKEVQ
jgi:co-chaperonin GroES (HSP10)